MVKFLCNILPIEITSYIAKAIGYARLALSFLTCENAECQAVFDYEMNKGYVPKGDVNFAKILNYRPAQGVRNLFNDGTSQAKTWFGSVGIGEGVTTGSNGELIPGNTESLPKVMPFLETLAIGNKKDTKELNYHRLEKNCWVWINGLNCLNKWI